MQTVLLFTVVAGALVGPSRRLSARSEATSYFSTGVGLRTPLQAMLVGLPVWTGCAPNSA